jgi:hypothetical protein
MRCPFSDQRIPKNTENLSILKEFSRKNLNVSWKTEPAEEYSPPRGSAEVADNPADSARAKPAGVPAAPRCIPHSSIASKFPLT